MGRARLAGCYEVATRALGGGVGGGGLLVRGRERKKFPVIHCLFRKNWYFTSLQKPKNTLILVSSKVLCYHVLGSCSGLGFRRWTC